MTYGSESECATPYTTAPLLRTVSSIVVKNKWCYKDISAEFLRPVIINSWKCAINCHYDYNTYKCFKVKKAKISNTCTRSKRGNCLHKLILIQISYLRSWCVSDLVWRRRLLMPAAEAAQRFSDRLLSKVAKWCCDDVMRAWWPWAIPWWALHTKHAKLGSLLKTK